MQGTATDVGARTAQPVRPVPPLDSTRPVPLSDGGPVLAAAVSVGTMTGGPGVGPTC
jgi:hypothetical protein